MLGRFPQLAKSGFAGRRLIDQADAPIPQGGDHAVVEPKHEDP